MKKIITLVALIISAGLFVSCGKKSSEIKSVKNAKAEQVQVNTVQTSSVQATQVQEIAEEKIERVQKEPLYVSAEKHGFKMGGAIGAGEMYKDKYKNMIASDFNSVTPTNELKLYSLLDSANRNTKNGMPAMKWGNADKILSWAQENNIKVRGHVLVWDAYMTEWFFYEDYNNKVLADAETIKERMKYCINEVISHCEEKFPGVIYAWDVVNEAVADGMNETKSDDPCRIRTSRSGTKNLYYETIGRDYVKYAFKYARECVEKNGYDIKLFYNDYNNFYADKRKAIINLVQEVNAKDKINPEGKILVDGIGMQVYVGGYGTQAGCMNEGDIRSIKETIELYASLGFEVQITEMAVRNYDKTQEAKHAEYYGKMASMLRDINKTANGKFTCWAIWALVDNPGLDKNNYVYKMNGPYGGIFDWQYNKKDELYNISDALAL